MPKEWVLKSNKFFQKYTGLNIFKRFKPRLEQIYEEEKKLILGFTNKQGQKKRNLIGALSKEMKLEILSYKFPEAHEAYAALEQDKKEKTSTHVERFLDELGKKYIEKGLPI